MNNQENEVGKTNILMKGKMENILTNGGSFWLGDFFYIIRELSSKDLKFGFHKNNISIYNPVKVFVNHD